METKTILSVFIFALVLFAAWRIYRDVWAQGKQLSNHKNSADGKNSTSFARSIALVLVYVGTMLGLTFLVLQTRWDQPRLIMVYVPLLLLVVLYGFYSYLHRSGSVGLLGYLALAVLIVGSSFMTTAKKAVSNFPVLKKNIQGDKYYGYTPDWENYLRMSEWCADSLPPSSLVACRKAPMSFVYGRGRPFFPVYSVIAIDSTTNLSNPDSALNYFNQNKVTHVLLANLRRNPNKIDGYIINTMHRMLQPIAQKYPQKIQLVKQIGNTEPSYLYEIKY
ncbi:MAG: hypothetical protein IPP71_20010 [Bacteroidetes bacterium]|nr:hypothetical protein [Bacteroidota bacterium]